MISDRKEKIEQLASSQEDMRLLQERIHEDVVAQFTTYSNNIFSKMKFFGIGIVIVIFILCFGFIVYLLIDEKVNPMEVKTILARYNLLHKSVDYKYIEQDIYIIMDYIQGLKKKYNKNKGFASFEKLKKNEVEQLASLILYYEKVESLKREFVLAIAMAETQMNKNVIGACGEQSMFQIMPYTFYMVYREMFSRYSGINIKSVFDTSQAALRYMVHCRNFAKDIYKVDVTYRQLSWLYNANPGNICKGIVLNDLSYIPPKTIKYSDRVMFYYTNYCASNFCVWYYEKDRTENTNNKK